MRRLLLALVLAAAACTSAGSSDTLTISGPPDGLALASIKTYELSESTLAAADGTTITAEQVRISQATAGNSMALAGGTRQVFGADQGTSAAWNDINNLNGEPGLVLTTWLATGEGGVDLVSSVHSGVSVVQFDGPSGELITAAASNPETNISNYLIWQQNGAWVALYSDTIPAMELASIARTVEPASLADLEAELVS